MINYKQKYLKYKLKYKKLKGGMNVSITLEQEPQHNIEKSIIELRSRAESPNLNLYIDNLINGGLYWLDSHSSVIDSVFKTSINIIYIQKLGVCSEDEKPKEVFEELKYNVININNHDEYYGPDGGKKKIGDKVTNEGIQLRFNLPNTLINDHIISIGGYAQHDNPESGYGVSGLFPITSVIKLNQVTLEYESKEFGPPSNLQKLAQDMNNIGNIFENNIITDYEEYGGNFKLSNLCRMLEQQEFRGTIFIGSCRDYNMEITDEATKNLMRQISSKANYNLNLGYDSYWNDENKEFISKWFNDNSEYLFNKAKQNIENRKYVFDLQYIQQANSDDPRDAIANMEIDSINIAYKLIYNFMKENDIQPITLNDYYYYLGNSPVNIENIDLIEFNKDLLLQEFDIELF